MNKNFEEAIEEITREIETIRERGGNSYVAIGMLLESGVSSLIENYFNTEDYHYVSVTSCGCAVTKYDILIQWI